jgi:hypothetical protein
MAGIQKNGIQVDAITLIRSKLQDQTIGQKPDPQRFINTIKTWPRWNTVKNWPTVLSPIAKIY